MYRSLGLVAAFVFALLLMTEVTAQNKSADVKKSEKDDTPKPPDGWKEYSPQDGTFAVWIPEKPKSQSTRTRTSTVNGQRMRINVLAIGMPGGPDYMVEELIVSAAFAKQFKTDEFASAFKDLLASEANGKVTDETDVKAGKTSGKEYRIEGGKNVTRARVFTTGTRVMFLKVTGTKDAVDGDAAKIFLESGRFTSAGGGGATGRTPTIYGGGFDAEFKDMAPEGGLLVGFEIGTSNVFNRDMIRSIKPIFRVGEKETVGMQHGTDVKNVVTVKAKPGYAVGTIAAKHGLGFDGMSITFMKVTTDGKLDPKDSYESDFVGTDEKKNPTKINNVGGVPVIGIVGKSNDKDMTGMGLLFKGQEAYEPKKK